MMNSYRPNKKNDRGRLLAVTALVIFLFLIDLVSGGKLRAQVRAGAILVSHWLSAPGSAIARSGIFSSRAALEAQNRLLTEELSQFEERAAGYDVLKAENTELRALSHMAQETPGVTAPIVSSIRSSPYGTFLIGAGSSDGIVRGSLVLTSGGFVVGFVSDTAAHSAVVREVFAPGATVEAILAGAAVSVAGSGGGNARTQAPRGLSVGINDPVVVPALGQRPVGIVGSVASSSASASQDVFIRLPVNLASLQYVYVVPL